MNRVRYAVLLVLLLGSKISLGADVFPDGDYNKTEVEVRLYFYAYQYANSDEVSIDYQVIKSYASVVGFDSADDSFHFNDGIAGGDLEYGRWVYYSLNKDSESTGSFSHVISASLYDPAFRSFTGQYTADNNMLSANGTEIQSIEDWLYNKLYMITPNHELMISSFVDKENDSFVCTGCDNGLDITEQINARDFGTAIALKKGSEQLTLADLTGKYRINASGLFVKCQDADQDGDMLDNRELCQNITRESWIDEYVVNFNGTGGCNVPSIKIGEIVNYYQAGNYIDSNIFTEGLIDEGPAVSCSYSVSGVDDVNITIDDGDDPETDEFKISADHRFLQGNGQFSASLPVPVDWDFESGTVWGMKIDTNPVLGSLTGNYFGFYQGSEFKNDCIADGDNNPATCPVERNPVAHFMANVSIAFNGAGSCTWSHYVEQSDIRLTEGDYLATRIEDTSDTEIATNCTYALESGTSVILITLQWTDETTDTLRASLSDDGHTIAFGLISLNDVSANPGTLIPAEFFPFVAGGAKEAKGMAIKYDGTVTNEIITKWLTAIIEKSINNDDFGGDGKADILLRNISSGQLYLYEMDGNNITGSNIGGLALDWNVESIGDFGGDGKADILLRNISSGQLFLFEMDGNSITPSDIGGLDTSWNIDGTGDFGGDGKTDILLRNSISGQLYLYEMDGNSITASNIGGLSLGWDVVDINDFGGDGKADILLRNISNGQLYLYEMDGNSITGSNIGGLALDWNIEGTGDFGGDGKADILLRNVNSGQLYLYEMEGNSITGSNIGGLDTSWDVERIADYGGDGKADILLRNSVTGQLFLYEMDGNSITPSNIGGLSSTWIVQDQ